MPSPIHNSFYICEPSLNRECKFSECYAHGGQCFLTSNEKAESPYISKEVVDKLSPTLGSDLLLRSLQQIRNERMMNEFFGND